MGPVELHSLLEWCNNYQGATASVTGSLCCRPARTLITMHVAGAHAYCGACSSSKQ